MQKFDVYNALLAETDVTLKETNAQLLLFSIEVVCQKQKGCLVAGQLL